MVELNRTERRKARYFCGLLVLILSGLLAAIFLSSDSSLASAKVSGPERRVNVPYLGPAYPAPSFTPAIFWFGEVTPNNNYADVRAWHFDNYLHIILHIIDRRLWYADEPSATDLTEWDAISLYLDLNGNNGGTPTSNSYRLVTQLHRRESSKEYQAAYRGNGSTWVPTSVSYTTERGWRGIPNTGNDAKGWSVEFKLPFTSLGLAGRPSAGTTWGLAAVVHDRDDASGSITIPDQVWPEGMNPNVPSSWGQMAFGIPGYNPPASAPKGSVTIRHGLNGASVVDGHVGGSRNCGSGLDHWTEWGEANYAGDELNNIQNQWDVSDYPCFSKFYITFPLNEVPKGKVIKAATLQMLLHRNSVNPSGETPDSYIQVLTIGEDWAESTLTWNNAPLAVENISGTWVKPHWLSPDPYYQWDVSRAVAEAYQSGQPLRLAMYSADGERHTGKYFLTSDSGSTNRPTLQVIWGELCDSLDVECRFSFLPLLSK